MSIGISSTGSNNSLPQRMDPNAYAQQYANQNGMTLDEAKDALKSQYGEPQQDSQSTSGTDNLFDSTGSDSSVSGSSSSGQAQSMNPDDMAQQLVDQGIAKDIEEARELLRQQYGDPSQDGSSSTGSTISYDA